MPRRRVRTAATDARRLAFEVLIRVESTAAFADVLLARRLADTPLPPREQALATRLVYGTLAWQGRLDAHLAQLVRDTAVDRLDAPVRAALRLGLYQLLFLDRVPAYAAVDASVPASRSRPPPAIRSDASPSSGRIRAGWSPAGPTNSARRRCPRCSRPTTSGRRRRCAPTGPSRRGTRSRRSSRPTASPRRRARGRRAGFWSSTAPRGCARSAPGTRAASPSRARPRS
ncbi:MAG: transcription antitermination protein NusB [Deltaproteobacteria bacterium]|nr:MAG: transcription antitermination protein NusB [Deltaproteobacteria bacterium]